MLKRRSPPAGGYMTAMPRETTCLLLSLTVKQAEPQIHKAGQQLPSQTLSECIQSPLCEQISLL